MFNYYLNQDNPDYWNLPEDQRRRYWHVPTEDGKMVALPKPVGLIGFLFTSPVEMGINKMIAGDQQVELKDLATRMFENVSPPEMPQAIKTLGELNAGEGGYSFFYDRPIVDKALQG